MFSAKEQLQTRTPRGGCKHYPNNSRRFMGNMVPMQGIKIAIGD